MPLRRSRIAAGSITLVFLVLCASAAAQSALTPPNQDPFYDVPGGLSAVANGTVLGSRPITALAAAVPLAAKAWEVEYKTLAPQGRPTATVATVLVPDTPWTGAASRPLVSFQAAEDGVGMTCSPSYTLHAGIAGIAGGSPSQVDILAGLPLLLARGWAVVVPDWEGPDSEFASAPMAGHAALDGIRAALRFPPDGLQPATPVGLWGYSGGGFATAVAAQMQRGYAPELHLAGIAMGGVPGDIRDVYRAANAAIFGGALTILFIGLDRADPAAHLDAALTPAGARVIAGAQSTCLGSAAAANPALNFTHDISAAGLAEFLQLQWHNSPLNLAGAPTAPVYDYHAVHDELVPFATAQSLDQHYCKAGVRVDFQPAAEGEHITEGLLGELGAVTFLGERFAGLETPDTCPPAPRAQWGLPRRHGSHHRRRRARTRAPGSRPPAARA
jgi:hypothetical protein